MGGQKKCRHSKLLCELNLQLTGNGAVWKLPLIFAAQGGEAAILLFYVCWSFVVPLWSFSPHDVWFSVISGTHRTAKWACLEVSSQGSRLKPKYWSALEGCEAWPPVWVGTCTFWSCLLDFFSSCSGSQSQIHWRWIWSSDQVTQPASDRKEK